MFLTPRIFGAFGLTLLEFHQELCRQKIRVSMLRFDVVCWWYVSSSWYRTAA